MATKAEVAKRRERMAELLVSGLPYYKVEPQIMHEFGVSDRTARRDYAELKAGARGALEDNGSIDLLVLSTMQRLQIRSAVADAKMMYNAATRADQLTLRLAGILQPRYAVTRRVEHAGGSLEDRERWARRLEELDAMDDDDLLERRRALHERLEAMGLDVLPGGKTGT